MYGVIYLTAFLLLPIFLHIYGYLDQRTYVKVIHQNSFYENSSEIILMYSHFNGFLLAISITLITTCICLTLVSFTNQTARYQIKCYRPYFTRHCIICVIPFVIRYINLTDTTSDDIMIEMDWERLFLVISSIFRFILSLFCVLYKSTSFGGWFCMC